MGSKGKRQLTQRVARKKKSHTERVISAFERTRDLKKPKSKNVQSASPFAIADQRRSDRKSALVKEYRKLGRTANRFREVGKHGQVIAAMEDGEATGEEEAVLTHGGQAIMNMDSFEKPVSLGTDGTTQLSAKFTEEAHFGGAVGGSVQTKMSKLSRAERQKQITMDLIADSKQRKMELKNSRDEAEQMTEKLDDQFKALLGSKAFASAAASNPVAAASGTQYDSIFRRLQMTADKRATATDKIGTAEDTARRQKRKLEEMEAARLAVHARPAGVNSALRNEDDDGEAPAKKRVRFSLSYNPETGRPMNGNVIQPALIVRPTAEESDSESDQGEDEEEDSGSGDEEDGIGVEGDVHSDLPFLIDMPTTFDEFKSLLTDRTADEQRIVLHRLLCCYHPSLAVGNKKLLHRLQLFVFRLVNELAIQPVIDDDRLRMMAALTCEISERIPKETTGIVLKLLGRYQREWKSVGDSQRIFPRFNFANFIRTVAVLYPTLLIRSHPVLTNVLKVTCDIMSQSRLKTARDHARALVLCSAVLHLLKETRRFVPECMAILHSAVKWIEVNIKGLVTNEDVSDSLSALFCLEKTSLAEVKQALFFKFLEVCSEAAALWSGFAAYESVFAPIEESLNKALDVDSKDVSRKVKSEITKVLKALKAKGNESASEIIEPVDSMEEEKPQQRTLPGIRMLEPRLEPKYNPLVPRKSSQDEIHRLAMKRELTEKKKLQKDYKREFRAVARKLRRDTDVIRRAELDAAHEKDAERNRKTKAIIASLQGQEADHQKLLKAKAKMKA